MEFRQNEFANVGDFRSPSVLTVKKAPQSFLDINPDGSPSQVEHSAFENEMEALRSAKKAREVAIENQERHEFMELYQKYSWLKPGASSPPPSVNRATGDYENQLLRLEHANRRRHWKALELVELQKLQEKHGRFSSDPRSSTSSSSIEKPPGLQNYQMHLALMEDQYKKRRLLAQHKREAMQGAGPSPSSGS